MSQDTPAAPPAEPATPPGGDSPTQASPAWASSIPRLLSGTTEPLHWRLYDRYRDYAKHEDSLINWRLTWMVALQSLAFAVLGLLLQKWVEVWTLPKDGSLRVPADIIAQLGVAMLLPVAIGLGSAWVTSGTVAAAKIAQDNLQQRAQDVLGLEFDKGDRNWRLKLCRVQAVSDPVFLPMITRGGLHAASRSGHGSGQLPKLFLIMWAVLLGMWLLKILPRLSL